MKNKIAISDFAYYIQQSGGVKNTKHFFEFLTWLTPFLPPMFKLYEGEGNLYFYPEQLEFLLKAVYDQRSWMYDLANHVYNRPRFKTVTITIENPRTGNERNVKVPTHPFYYELDRQWDIMQGQKRERWQEYLQTILPHNWQILTRMRGKKLILENKRNKTQKLTILFNSKILLTTKNAEIVLKSFYDLLPHLENEGWDISLYKIKTEEEIKKMAEEYKDRESMEFENPLDDPILAEWIRYSGRRIKYEKGGV